MTDGNELRFDYAALPERVWEAMTNPTRAAAWLPDGLVAQVGRRFTFPGPNHVTGEVIAVDPPNRVVLRWRRPTELGAPVVESVMTWVVARAPGGASVRVVPSSIEDPGAADVVVAVRTLFDERLRTVLRSAHGPVPVSSSPPVLVDVATPAPALGMRAGADEPAADGRSQVVSAWPILRKVKVRPPGSERRRRTGSALAYRLIAVIAIAAAVAVITLGAAAIPWANSPEESTLAGDPGLGSRATLDPAAQANLVGGSPGSAGTAPGTGTTPTGGSTGIPPTIPTVTVPPVIPPLTVSLDVVNPGPLDYTVKVTINNPAGSPQPWLNVRVHINGVISLITVVGSVVDLLLGGNDPCFAPATTTNIGAGQTLTFSFTVKPGLSEPTQALLNQGGC